MNRLARWLILTGVTSIVLILTAVLMIAASPAVAATPRIEPQTGTTAALAPDLAKALATAAPDQRLNVIVEMR